MSRLDSREYNWYVLCVPAQEELAVQKIMDGEGFATFVPVAIKPKFANAAALARMVKVEVALPIMPRYMFIGMSDRTPGWARVFCYTGIFNRYKRRLATGVLGVNGKPAEVRHDTIKGKNGEPDMPGLRAFMLRHSKGEFNAPGYHKKMRQTGREFGPGDTVTTEGEGITFRVIDIEDGKAGGFVKMFGKVHKVNVSIENLFLVE